MWNAPEAMNRMWSVFTGPYLVPTVVPSISGRRSRWTPSRLTSAPMRSERAQILSISSRKTMPLFSTFLIASCTIMSLSISLSDSSLKRMSKQSRTVTLRGLVRVPKALPSMSERLIMPTWLPGMPGISNDGIDGMSATWISISRVVELVCAQALAEGLARRDRGACADQRIEHALLGVELRLGGDLLALGVAHEPDARFEQVADDLIDVAADITDFGEFGGLDLDEGRARELGEAPRDLGLADAGRADHEDVLGQNLLAHVVIELLPAPAIAESDGDGALGVALADDVAVELGDDLAGGKTCHRCVTRYLPASSVSTTTWSLV